MRRNGNEICTIIVGGRDKYSPTKRCLESIINNTPESHELICILGGAPLEIQKDLLNHFNSQVQFIFKDEFLNQPQARNIGLKVAKSQLAVVMDNDVTVRPGWLTPLIQCQKATNSAMVVPLILENDNVIHTAGNDLYITYKSGKSFGHKVLRYYHKIYEESSNLKRQPTDYGELHCQLVEVKTALKLGAFDDKIREVGECDSGLTWAKAGCAMYFEPESVVLYNLHHPVRPEDIRFFEWRWDMKGILDGYKHFENKWKMDITEHGGFAYFLLAYNKKLGFWARKFPSKLALKVDNLMNQIYHFPGRIFGKILGPWRRFIAWRLGFYAWAKYYRK